MIGCFYIKIITESGVRKIKPLIVKKRYKKAGAKLKRLPFYL